MKRYLGVFLAFAIIISCTFVGIDFSKVDADTPSGTYSVSVAVREQNGFLGGAISCEQTQYVLEGEMATVSAVPYYGNGFLGWYDGDTLVSTELNYSFPPVENASLTAVFDIKNYVENGNAEIESAHSAMLDAFNNPAVKYDKTYYGSASVVSTSEIENSQNGYGNYAIKFTPSQANNASKTKALVNIPLTVEKNTDYILRFSYKYDDNSANFDKSRTHYIQLALNGADSKGNIQFNDTDHTIKWTYHSHPSSTVIDPAVKAYTNVWSWGGADGYVNDSGSLIGKFVTDNGTANFKEWQDVYLLFNPGEDADVFRNGDVGTIYVSLGTPAATTDFVLVDNLSLSKAEANSLSAVNASKGGSITSDTKRSAENYYVYTMNTRGNANAFTGRDTSKVYYPSIYEQFTATANEGTSFIGWFDENDVCVSNANTAFLLMTGKQYTAKFASGLSCEGGGCIVDNGDGTYTAKAFYGNKFLGWYDGTVTPYVHKTDELTITKADHLGYVAVFTNENLIYDGDFEVNNNTAGVYDAYLDYDSKNAGGSYSVVPTCIEGGSEFGNYCLQITPKNSSHASKRKGLLNIPVELEAGKRYLWKFSYAIVANTYTSSTDYLLFSVDKANSNGKIPWDSNSENGEMVDYSFHAQLASVAGDYTSDWAWGNYLPTPYAYSNNKNISGVNQWVDMYIVIDADSSETYYLTLGAWETQYNNYLIDNMSLTELESNVTCLADVKALQNGKVESYRTDEAAYKTVSPQGTSGIYTNGGVVKSEPLYPDMYVDYFATADVGYLFDGWYNTSDGSLVSRDRSIRVKFISDEKIEARFKADTTEYKATATIDNADGIYGGYIVGESVYNSVASGESVTFTVVPYQANTFLGWYDGSNKVSDDLTVTYKIRKDVTLTAKFKNDNLFSDSGYENKQLTDSVMGDTLEWQSNGATATVIGNDAFEGKRAILVTAPSISFSHTEFSVTANKDYYLSFVWKSVEGTELEYVKVINGTKMVAEWNEGAAASGEWQKFYMNFNTGDNDKLSLEIKYKSDNASIMLDNLVLCDATKIPFTVTASVVAQDGIFGGYITGDSEITKNYGENVTVKAKPYVNNEFLGWYDGETLVSTDSEYTFAIDGFKDLVARFVIKNLWVDSGYENTEPNVSLSENGNWVVNEKLNESYGFDVTVTDTGDTWDGSQMLSALHRNNAFSTTVSGLKENTNYYLTFRVRTHKTLDNCFFQTAKIIGTYDSKTLGTGFGTANGGQWEFISVPFATGKNTEIKVELSYSAGEGACYFDDFALFESNNIGVYANDGGTVTSTLNGGENGPAVTGTSVTVTATADAGNTFLGWYDYLNPNELLSTANPYTFMVTDTQHIVAKFEGENVEPENMVIDGDFENGCFEGFIFAGTTETADCSFCNYQVTKKVGEISPVSGSYMLKLTANSRNSSLLVKNLKPFTDYTVSFYWLGNEYIEFPTVTAFRYLAELEGFVSQEDMGATKQVSKYYRANSNMKRYDSIENVNVNGTGDGTTWRKVEFAFNTGNRDAAIILFNYTRYGGTDGIYFDNIKVTEGSHYSDDAANGNFESENGEKGWQGEFTVTENNGNKYGVSSSYMYNGVNTESVKGYKLSFKAKSEADAKLVYGMADSGEKRLVSGSRITAMTNASYNTVDLTSEWKEYTLYFQTRGYKQGNLVFESLNGTEFMLDDVKFERADTLVPVNYLTFEDTEEKYIINAAYASTLGDDHDSQENPDWYDYSDVAHTGNGSLVMKYNSEYASHELSQPWAELSLESGRSYTVSFWAKAERAGTKFMSGVVRTDTSFKLGFLSENVYELKDTEWTKFTYTFTTDNLWYAANSLAQFVVNGIEGETDCDIYFDDIVIYEGATSVNDTSADMLYTQDISQNYFADYSFEKSNAEYIKSGDASHGSKYLTVKAGQKIIIPVSTRTDYNLAYNCTYTFAADIRGNSDAKGTVYLAYSADGSGCFCDKNGKAVTLSVNTDGKWKRSGFSFDGNRNETEYLVIECTGGSFSVDYVALFNAAHSFEEYVYNDPASLTKDEIEYVNMSDAMKDNYISGNLTGLPEGSYVILKGDKTYESAIDENGNWFIDGIKNGKYNMYVLAGGNQISTLWGDVTFKDGKVAGLAATRLNGEVVEITGTGAQNGIIKVTDTDSGYAYLTATDDAGAFRMYILDCVWNLDGTTNDPELLSQYGISLEDFGAMASEPETEAPDDTEEADKEYTEVIKVIKKQVVLWWVIIVAAAATLVAAAVIVLLVLNKKKGAENR